MCGYRIRRLSIQKAIRLRCRIANRNPTPLFERRMAELKKRMDALTNEARAAGLLEP